MLGTEKHLDKQEIGYRQQFLLQNMSVDDDNEPRKLFTLYDIKDDETSKSALEVSHVKTCNTNTVCFIFSFSSFTILREGAFIRNFE